jgi:DNA-binding MarR family transcriptional regulator
MIAYSARIQEIRKLFGEYVGLTGVQYTILISISQMEEIADVGVNAVADHLHLSGAFVTTEVNKLAKLKLVTKAFDKADRRRIKLSVTHTGQNLLAKLATIQVPVNDALFSSLSKEEFAQTASMVTRLLAHADEALALLRFQAKKHPPT